MAYKTSDFSFPEKGNINDMLLFLTNSSSKRLESYIPRLSNQTIHDYFSFLDYTTRKSFFSRKENKIRSVNIEQLTLIERELKTVMGFLIKTHSLAEKNSNQISNLLRDLIIVFQLTLINIEDVKKNNKINGLVGLREQIKDTISTFNKNIRTIYQQSIAA